MAAAELRFDVDLSGWKGKTDRIQKAIDRMAKTDARLEYTGTHSELHTKNASIARHELRRSGGDKNAIFPLDDGDKEQPARLLAKRLKMVADGASAASAVDAMKNAIRLLRMAVYRNVLADKTTGPARRPEWNAYKAAHFSPPTPKMVASREWLNSLRAKVNGKDVGKWSGGGAGAEAA